MNAELAQIVTLAAHVNSGLQRHPFDFTLDHPTAAYCASIDFIEIPEGGTLDDATILAENPPAWFEFLKGRGVEYVRLHYLSQSSDGIVSDRISAAFANGGGRWLIEAVRGDKCDIWDVGWKTVFGKGDRIWKVSYLMTAADWPLIENSFLSIEEASARLLDALVKIEEFANRHERSKHWARTFRDAQDVLSSDSPLTEHAVLPKGYEEPGVEKLLTACYEAWVFGGMGWWNDLWFGGEEQEVYDQVSDQLYLAICLALLAVVNSCPIPTFID